MRVLLQRVRQASVSVEGQLIGRIGNGLAVLVGVGAEDTEEDASYLANKLINLRVFPGQDSEFDRSALDVGAEFLLVSQFTLYADTRKGRRPSFTEAAPPREAEKLVDLLAQLLGATGLKVVTGKFGAHMLVEIHNDGPVTIFMDSRELMARPRRG